MGIAERKAAPLFADLAQRFVAHVEARHENKPQTVAFYASKLSRLLEFPPLAGARIDGIDEGVIERYVVARRATVGPATVNRELATLRRMLRLAHEWKEIQRVPRIRLVSGERVRDFVLSRQQEAVYLAACRQPLHDLAVLMLESGLRIGEALNLEWADVTLEPIQGARFGFLRVREGKSKNARRIIPLTDRAAAMLKTCSEAASLPLVAHPHMLRHACGFALADQGADTRFIQDYLGHRNIQHTVKYTATNPARFQRLWR